ncbi:MAG: peroxiredoxin [Candidatus Thermoplasmatota archaeon]|nr:peroxiredoxin [Candidatus Thermoplasmatota archaeon]MCL5962748.1 peroxiredoxin [Candidatus Thermoplasmatota archaeon]
MVKLDEKAPDFELEAYVSEKNKPEKIRLKDYRGKWVVLFFYPRDFTFVCPTELREFAKRDKEFNKINTKILAASTDSYFSHKAWIERDLPEIKYPVIADTTHSLSRDYGVLDEKTGDAYRGIFVIDPDGIIQYIVISNKNVGRSVSETFRVVQALQTGGLCPVEWKPGEKLLN